MSCEWHLHSYTSCDYEFIMLFLGEIIYITIGNVSVSGRGSCPEDVSDTLLRNLLRKGKKSRCIVPPCPYTATYLLGNIKLKNNNDKNIIFT